MVFYLKYCNFFELNNSPAFQFSTASEAKAHISANFDDGVWLAYAQKPPKENEDSPDFFAYDSVEAAKEAIDGAYIEMGGAISNIANN